MEIASLGITNEALHRIVGGAGVATLGQIDAQEIAAEDIEIIAGDVFVHAGATDARLDIDGVRAGEHPAVLDADVAHAAGCFAADADAGEVATGQRAVGDHDVFARTAEARAVHAAAGFQADAIVAI